MAVDREAVTTLAFELLEATHRHFLARPRTPDSNLEALNALAVVLAPIFASARLAGHEDEARTFFAHALDNQIAERLEQERLHG